MKGEEHPHESEGAETVADEFKLDFFYPVVCPTAATQKLIATGVVAKPSNRVGAFVNLPKWMVRHSEAFVSEEEFLTDIKDRSQL